MKSELEDYLALQIRGVKLPDPKREYRFHPTRKWRFDFAYPELMLAIEVEGGIWTNGAHSRGKHYNSDCDKYNNATLMGWSVLRFTETHVKNGEALKMIETVLNG